MEESGTKLHISIVLKHFALFSQKLSVYGRVPLYLHNVITTKINMGNQFNVRKENSVQTKGQKKSKGERLGWESLSGYRPVPLRTVVGDGIPVVKTCRSTRVKLVP